MYIYIYTHIYLDRRERAKRLPGPEERRRHLQFEIAV